MAKPIDPKAIEAERQTSSRAERRGQKRRQMQDEISYNQRGNGVIIIPPQKRREFAEEPPKLRVAAYCRVDALCHAPTDASLNCLALLLGLHFSQGCQQ